MNGRRQNIKMKKNNKIDIGILDLIRDYLQWWRESSSSATRSKPGGSDGEETATVVPSASAIRRGKAAVELRHSGRFT